MIPISVKGTTYCHSGLVNLITGTINNLSIMLNGIEVK
jgi:hypothetical protein